MDETQALGRYLATHGGAWPLANSIPLEEAKSLAAQVEHGLEGRDGFEQKQEKINEVEIKQLFVVGKLADSVRGELNAGEALPLIAEHGDAKVLDTTPSIKKVVQGGLTLALKQLSKLPQTTQPPTSNLLRSNTVHPLGNTDLRVKLPAESGVSQLPTYGSRKAVHKSRDVNRESLSDWEESDLCKHEKASDIRRRTASIEALALAMKGCRQRHGSSEDVPISPTAVQPVKVVKFQVASTPPSGWSAVFPKTDLQRDGREAKRKLKSGLSVLLMEARAKQLIPATSALIDSYAQQKRIAA
eukprot:jgi/Mesen1/6496/ME000332S05499